MNTFHLFFFRSIHIVTILREKNGSKLLHLKSIILLKLLSISIKMTGKYYNKRYHDSVNLTNTTDEYAIVLVIILIPNSIVNIEKSTKNSDYH